MDTCDVIILKVSDADNVIIGSVRAHHTNGTVYIGKSEETVFIDDSVRNLEGAAKLGITPILIAANPASDVDSSYLKIHTLSELLK